MRCVPTTQHQEKGGLQGHKSGRLLSRRSHDFDMLRGISFTIIIITIFGFLGCNDDTDSDNYSDKFRIVSAQIDSINLVENELIEGIPVDGIISISFSKDLDPEVLKSAVSIKQGTDDLDFSLKQISGSGFEITPVQKFRANFTYYLEISEELSSLDESAFSGAIYRFKTQKQSFQLVSASYGERQGVGEDRITDVPLNLSLTLSFSLEVDLQSLSSAISIGKGYPLKISKVSENAVLVVTESNLPPVTRFVLSISDNLMGANGEEFSGYAQEFYTQFDQTPKFPVISDEELLTKVQQQTFRYFWDFAHPNSGLARERNSSGDIVTIGGSGFGVMAILVGIERGFIGRPDGIQRLTKIVDFLGEADRFHGVWPHWVNGNTGAVVPFSTKDNGGDLVETAFMIQGLLAVRAYLDENDPGEKALIDKITTLWEEVEWSWYARGGNVLYWHWSPEYNWEMNHPIRGYNEALIVYVLAAASPTYPVTKEVYEEGWAQNGGIVNGSSFYDIDLPVGYDYGGPLFFAHYSFMGLDPRNLSDQYADYWVQNVNHSLINQAYCVANPKKYVGYSEDCWGLTASDNHQGYSAHSPTNDLGVITPTAALSSFPYTPEASMRALKFFYYIMGDKLWGEYGFYDAFNVTENWTANSYLAIDQGPIVVMIENHRSGLLWDIFMTDPDVKKGLNTLNFNY